MTIYKYSKNNRLYTLQYEHVPCPGRILAYPYNWGSIKDMFEVKLEADKKRFIPVSKRE